MLYVVFGYCSPDHYTSTNRQHVLVIKEFNHESEVADHYRQFVEDLPKSVSEFTYRVFDGRERTVIAVDGVVQIIR